MAKITTSWQFGRGSNSLRGEMKKSIKVNKKRLRRRARRCAGLSNGNFYKKLAREAAYDLVS